MASNEMFQHLAANIPVSASWGQGSAVQQQLWGENVLHRVALGLPWSVFVPDVKLLFFSEALQSCQDVRFFEGFSEPQLIITTCKNAGLVLVLQCSDSCRKCGGRCGFTAPSPTAFVRSERSAPVLLCCLLQHGVSRQQHASLQLPEPQACWVEKLYPSARLPAGVHLLIGKISAWFPGAAVRC